jgi:hypothetical protein
MVKLSSGKTRADVRKELALEVRSFVYSEQIMPSLEETLIKSSLELTGDTPGNFCGNLADPCRTEICTCTRAVPHGSFL